jgi:hypothetical protein
MHDVYEVLTERERALLTFDHRGALLRLSHGVRIRRREDPDLERSFWVLTRR